MLAITFDLTTINAYLQRPDILFTNLLIWVGWVPIAAVLIWGFLEVWLDNRQEKYRASRRYVLLAIDVPRETEQSPAAVEHVFASIASSWGGPNFKEKWFDGEVAPVNSFEIVSTGGYIQYYVRTQIKYRDMIESAIYAQYPDAEIFEAEDYTQNLPDYFPNDEYSAWGTEQKLRQPEYFPIRTYMDFEHKLSQELKDPLAALLEGYSKLRPGEHLWTQILVMPLGPKMKSWTRSGQKYIYETVGTEDKSAKKKSGVIKESVGWIPGEIMSQLQASMATAEKKEDPWKFLRTTPLEKARLESITDKISKPGLNVKIRHVYIAKHDVWYKSPRDKMVKGVFEQFTNMESNRFGRVSRVTPKKDYFWQRWWADTRRRNVVRAYKMRNEKRGGTPFVLNTEELASIWHFPSILLRAPFISKTLAKRAEPPVQLPTIEQGEEPSFVEKGMDTGPQPLPVEFISPEVAKEKTLSPAVIHKKAAPPMELPTSEPEEKAPEPVAPPEPVEPTLPSGTTEKQQNRETEEPTEKVYEEIPEALKVLITPGVEIGDVGLKMPDPNNED